MHLAVTFADEWRPLPLHEPSRDASQTLQVFRQCRKHTRVWVRNHNGNLQTAPGLGTPTVGGGILAQWVAALPELSGAAGQSCRRAHRPCAVGLGTVSSTYHWCCCPLYRHMAQHSAVVPQLNP